MGGVPARTIRPRYDAAVISRLLQLRWWDWPEARIAEKLPAIRAGDLQGLLAP